MKKILTRLSAGLIAALMLASCNGGNGQGNNTEAPGTTQAPATSGGDTTSNTPTETRPVVGEMTSVLGLDIDKYVKVENIHNLGLTLNVYCDDRRIDEEIYAVAAKNGYYKEDKTGETKKGDVLNISYAGSVEGIYFAGGTAADALIELSDTTGYIEGFDADLYGITPGTTVRTTVTFPENYAEELAGLEAVFEITVNYIYDYCLTDENVADITKGKYTNIADYREYLRNNITIDNLKNFKTDKTNALIEKLGESMEVIAYPEGQVEYYYNEMLNYYMDYAEAYGMSLADFYSYAGLSEESILESSRAYARDDLVCAVICAQAGIEMSDAEYITMLEELAASYGYKNKYEMEEEYGKTYLQNYFAGQLCREYLAENVEITTDYDQYKHMIEEQPESTGGEVTGG